MDLDAVPSWSLNVYVGERVMALDGPPLLQLPVRILDVDRRVVGRGTVAAHDDGVNIWARQKVVVCELVAVGEVDAVEIDYPARCINPTSGAKRQGTVSIAGAGMASPGSTCTLTLQDNFCLYRPDYDVVAP